MLYGLVIAVHAVVCIMLIAVILLQAGRGGGLSETFGGDSSQTIFGTKVSTFLTRATVVVASLFLVTSLLLGIMTSRRGKSLVELQKKMLPLNPETNFGPNVPEETEGGAPLAEPEESPKE